MATKFYLEKRKDKQGNHPILVSVAMYHKRLLTTVGYNISANSWDDKKQRVKHGATVGADNKKLYNEVNKRLNEIETFFTNLEISLNSSPNEQKELILKDIFNKNFKRKQYKSKKEKTLFDYIDVFLREESRLNSLSHSTAKIFYSLKNHLSDFKSDLTFNDLDESTLFDFVEYLQKMKLPNGRIGMLNSTLKKHITYLKWFLRWANKKGKNNNTAFIDFEPKLKTAPKQVVFLEWNELLHVYNYKFTGEDAKRLEKVRDVFCFMCFTGLRYSDTENLKRTDITNEAITITTQKTSDTITIELNDYSKEILSKYENEKYPYNKALPVISNQKMNAYLKEMAEVCNLNEPITQVHFRGNQRVETIKPKYELISTHTGRRTFISNALIKGIPANIVMEFTGHSDYKSMEPYIAIAKNARKDAMKVFNK